VSEIVLNLSKTVYLQLEFPEDSLARKLLLGVGGSTIAFTGFYLVAGPDVLVRGILILAGVALFVLAAWISALVFYRRRELFKKVNGEVYRSLLTVAMMVVIGVISSLLFILLYLLMLHIVAILALSIVSGGIIMYLIPEIFWLMVKMAKEE
jgi:hypothetical protein